MDTSYIYSFAYAIDNKDINVIENLIKNNNKNNNKKNKKNNKKNNKTSNKKSNNQNKKNDIIFEMYEKSLLTSKRLQFIMKTCLSYFNISTILMKKLIKDKKVTLLDIIFDNIKFYDNEFIIHLLLKHYKNRIAISTTDLNRQISLDKFKISTDNTYLRNSGKYLFNEFNKDCVNIIKVKHLIEYGANIAESDINTRGVSQETLLFKACRSGNETAIKYLIEHGAYINITNWKDETPLFEVCGNGNEPIVKYLVEHGADINIKNTDGETPLFKACYSENLAIVKYLVEHGANINKGNENG